MNKSRCCWRCEARCNHQCSRCRVAFYCSKACQKQDKWRHEPDCDDAVLKTECFSCGLEQLEEGMMKCTSCMKACYCSAECQRNHWPRHMPSCQKTAEKIIELADKIKSMEQLKKHGGSPATYYWGNVPAVDLINLSMNEGEEYCNPLALLLCGVGDPRNVLLTISSLPEVYKQQVTFVLNDICPCTLARSVLLLYMLHKGGNDVTNTVIHIWYSLCISEQDFTLMMSALQELVASSDLRLLTEDVMEISADQLSHIKDVWSTWLRLAKRKGSWVAKLRQEAIACDLEREKGLNTYMHAIPKEHRISARRFFDTGIFASRETSKGLKMQNPTLTGRGFQTLSNNTDFCYSTPMNVLPFTGWDYKAIKKICHADSLPEMYSIYLSQILHKFVEKLKRKQVKFHFILANALDIEAFLPADLRYDRITTSNLWDYCPPTVLLTKFKGFLNSTNRQSVLITETNNWVRDYMPEIVFVLPQLWGMDDLNNKAVRDTGNPDIHESGMSAVVEYLNITREFLMFLRASLLAASTGRDLASFKRKKKIPSLNSAVGSLGLDLRDFIRNKNRVFPFRWALNCRRVTMLRGYERALEWKLSSEAKSDEGAKE